MENIKENPRFVTMPQVHPAQVDCLCDVPGYLYMENEIWVNLIGFDGYYQISNLGRVKSLTNRNRCGITKRELILKQGIFKDGYLKTVFSINNKRFNLLTHRYVLASFFGYIPDKPQINHINGIKTDNRLENLEWCTRSENMKHAYKLGLELPCNNGLQKNISIIKNNEIIKTYPSIREMCRIEKLDRRSVQRVIDGKFTNHKGLNFKINEKP
jgi:hypothetical protein